ncbi:MAG: FIST C-terminal domain-containing protein [Planctomycetota bacterium]|jgi:hypothetical protein|nr:FIST C-terminal domain-containing protein [Planctomycetota bacterium]
MELLSTYATFNSGDAKKNAVDAATKIKRDFSVFKPAQVVFFAPDNYHAGRLAAEMRDAFPDAVTFGCSSGGEIANGMMLKNSVAAMAFGQYIFEFFDLVAIPRLGPDSRSLDHARQVDEAFARFASSLKVPSLGHLDYTQYFGFAFADGRHYFVEPILERAGDLTGVRFVGGIAGDGIKNRYTPVFLNGQAIPDAIILGLAKPRVKFSLLKTQGMKVPNDSFVITKANERVIYELDNQPAASVYAKAVGVSENEFSLMNTFARYPLGVMVGEEPYLRVVMDSLPDGSLCFSHALREGTRIKICELSPIVSSTAAALEEQKRELGGIGGILHINCALRHLVLEEKNELEVFGGLFRGFPNVGFASHGEIFIAIANFTSTMLVLGKD